MYLKSYTSISQTDSVSFFKEEKNNEESKDDSQHYMNANYK